jgi:hypothetical protein
VIREDMFLLDCPQILKMVQAMFRPECLLDPRDLLPRTKVVEAPVAGTVAAAVGVVITTKKVAS